MNQLLDSRLEALAFNYVSFGIFTIVNNLWTWAAVLTAALSFWRIRAASAAVTSSASVKSIDQKPSTSIFDRAHDESRSVPEADENPTRSSSSASTTASYSVVETSVSQLVCKGRKLKLTVYYEEDEETSNVDGDVDGEMTVTEWSDGGGECKEGNCGGEWWESWERVLRLRNGEMGWYRYQDLSVLNGNVVRLWDDDEWRR